MWYRFAGRKEILQILNNNPDQFTKVKRMTSGINERVRHLYDYLAAFYINEDESQLKNLIDDLYEYNKQYPDLFSSNPQNFRINKTIYDRNTPFLTLNEIVHSLGILNKKQDNITHDIHLSEEGVEIFPINSASDAMKFNAILPWQGTPWCITWHSGNLWWSYRTQIESTFYIVIDHDRSPKDPLYAVAINHSENGLNLTDLRNTQEYSASKYLQELHKRHPEISNANFPHKPLTEEEEHEHYMLKNEIDDLDDFIALTKKYIKDPWLKYIQFPHSLTDEQLQYLLSLGNASKELIKAYVNNSMGISPQQQKMLSDEDLKSYERIKQHNLEFADKNGTLDKLWSLSEADKDPDYQQKIIDLGLSKDENGSWNHPEFNPGYIIDFIPENQLKNYINQIIDHPKFDPNFIIQHIPEDLTFDFAISMLNNPKFNLNHAISYIPVNQKLDYIDKVINQPGFYPNHFIGYIPENQRSDYIDKVWNHPKFDPNHFITNSVKQRSDYIDKVWNHPEFDPNDRIQYIPDNQKLDYMNKVINHPKFNLNDFLHYIPSNQRLDYIDKIMNHPKFEPNYVFNYIPNNQKLDYINKVWNHPKFDLESIKKYLPESAIQELLQKYPNNSRVIQSFRFIK